jgi:hypothetical protein
LSQFFLERMREGRAAHRAKLLIAGELLHAQNALRTVAAVGKWPPIEDLDGFLPTSAWRENRSSMADKVSEELWFELVLTYSILELDRSRFITANKAGAPFPLTPELIEGMQKTSNRLGELRRKLGLGGGWLGSSPAFAVNSLMGRALHS